jgi:hypothetical protein
MPKLGDVIGALLSDVARARVRADIEAMTIAEAYSRDPLLKHFPVPRFTLPEIVVDLPVLVSTVDAGTMEGIVTKPTKAEIRQAVREGVARSDLRLPRTQITAVTTAALERADELLGTSTPSLHSPGWIASEVASAVVGSLESRGRDTSPEQLRTLAHATTASMSALLSTKIAPSPMMDVMVASGEIKAHADNESVVRLRLTIAEDAYEVIPRDDGQGYYLTPQ